MSLINGRVENGVIVPDSGNAQGFALEEGDDVMIHVDDDDDTGDEFSAEDLAAMDEADAEFDAGMGLPAEPMFKQLARELGATEKRTTPNTRRR